MNVVYPSRTRARGVRLLVWVVLLGSLFGLLFENPAYADSSTATGAQACVQGFCHSVSLFNDMDTTASNTSARWISTITGIVSNTFWILAVIEICWAAAVWVYEKDSLNSLTIEVIKKIMFISFFYTLLLNAPSWIPTIVGSFSAVGRQAANAPYLSTDYIIAMGLATCDLIMGKAPHLNIINVWGNIPKYIVAAFCCFGVLICFVLMAAEYFCALMESYILLATGAVFLGLGSSTWTKDYVTKYLNYAITVGVRLLVMMLCWELVTVMAAGDIYSWNYGSMLEQLGIAILKCMLFLKAPDMTNALMNGGTGLAHGAVTSAVSSPVNAANTTQQLGGGIKGAAEGTLKAATAVAKGGAGMALLGAHGVAKGVKGGADMARSGAKGIRNFAEAAKAGTELAQQQGKRGHAAVLAGLGKATGAVAKNMPHSMANAILGITGGHQPGPGPIKRAHESLARKAAAGRDAGDEDSSADGGS